MEYLLFRGFTQVRTSATALQPTLTPNVFDPVFAPQTFRQFNKERSSDKCKGFDVDKILEQISDLIGR